MSSAPRARTVCPSCGQPALAYEYGFMSRCPAHGVVDDLRPAATKAREQREAQYRTDMARTVARKAAES